MRAASFLNSCSRMAARCLAGVLSLLMGVLPLAAQTQDDSVRNSGHLSARSSKSESARRQKARNKQEKDRNQKRKPASRGATASRAAKAARTARLRQAFVASTELRPMAQQLATMRTPEAYAGVTAYARKHSGEAAAAAYLALGHAYLQDKRYTEAEASLRQARQDGDELADYADFLGRRPAMKQGTRRPPRRCCTDLRTAIRTAFSMPRRRNWRPTSCWP